MNIGNSGKQYSPNKAFKSDSQRTAFFIPSLGFVFTVVWIRLGGSVAHTLMRRYVNGEKMTLQDLESISVIAASWFG
ncbi:hypothetical protein R7O13_23090, partial [Vibrio sp. Y176]|uniref:hypothetical protein n=1 Tax=Vibrio sp. Y176 TaxID=3074704 RepID=UPI002965A670